MKNKWILALSLMLAIGTASAQNLYDAERLSSNDLNGTARFVGMGGAMGALGGDISTIGTNPAGIGIFRSSDVSVTLGYNNTGASAKFMGTKMNEDKSRASFDQIGFVYSNKIGNTTSLRYVNFGFNYHKSKNFNRIFSMGGALDGYSQTWQMTRALENVNITESELNDIFESDGNPYTSSAYAEFPVLGIMGIRTGLVGWEANSHLGYDSPAGWNGTGNNFFSEEKGGISEYDFNISFNLNDRVYLGLTLGAYDVKYDRYTSYTENLMGYQSADGSIWSIQDDGDVPVDNGGYTLDNYYRLEGAGIDLKLGAIIRPIEESPFRFGFAIHTPTWYDLSESYNASLSSDIYAFDDREIKPFEKQTLSDYLGGDYLNYDYRIYTPWKFNVNMGTTIGTALALGAEYEFEDYSTAKLKDVDGYDLGDQNSVETYLKGVHTARIGLEYRIVPEFSFRAGYNFSSRAYYESAYNALAPYSTNTTYLNLKDKQSITCGVGYRGSVFYADLAYKYDTYRSAFFAFDDDIDGQFLPQTDINHSRHQLLFTLGARF